MKIPSKGLRTILNWVSELSNPQYTILKVSTPYTITPPMWLGHLKLKKKKMAYIQSDIHVFYNSVYFQV